MVRALRATVPDFDGKASADGSLSLLLQRLLAGSPDWSISVDEVWAHAKPSTTLMRQQGWKLHVSATVGSAARVLRSCAPILVEAGCAFKIARDLTQVEMLTHGSCPRGNAGKVMTVYPADDAQAVTLARRLDAATHGLDGPRVLSDRQLRAGSLVHYRFGAFTGVPHVSHDGEVSAALTAPDGTVVPDRREAGLVAPTWVTCPFPTPNLNPTPTPVATRVPTAAGSGGVLLDNRYTVREAIRHANRGGVFRATDTGTGQAVVLKQARAHVDADAAGTDVRDRLRNEATMLRALAGAGVAPQVLGMFETDGDLFLAEEDLGGSSLRSWVTQGMSDGVVTRPVDDTRDMVRSIAVAVETCHRAGIVLRDLGPNNVVVTPSGEPMLVDLEFATLVDGSAPGNRSGTVAYSAPEQFGGAAPALAADSHALGATLLYCFTGEDPYLRSGETIEQWVRYGLRPHTVPAPLIPLALRLCATDPAARPSVPDAVQELADATTDHRPLSPSRAVQLPFADLSPITDSVADDAIDTLIARLLTDVRPERPRVARRSTFGETTLAANVQHGAAGILAVMVQAWRARGGDELQQRIRQTADWLDRALCHRTPNAPVGLYFGWAGPCWALADAGTALGDPDLVQRAVDHALALDVTWPGPDITHGTAGLGLALLHLSELTEDPRLLPAVAAVASHLAGQVGREGDHVSWRTPAAAASTFAGTRYHGYAHGTAGIATFLDAAGVATGTPAFTDLADAAALTLHDAAVASQGLLRWGSGPEQPGPVLAHWCNGSSGVATFLARRSDAAGDVDVLDRAARAVVADKWHSGVAYCHGLPGNADLLLDLAERFGGPYREWAGDLLRLTWERRSSDIDGVGLTDEIGRITPDFNVGYTGALSVLLRWRHGGRRLFVPAAVR